MSRANNKQPSNTSPSFVKNSVVALSSNLGNKENNATWTNKLSNPLIINNGDVISVKSVFVDARQNSTTNIILDNDVAINIGVCYYYIHGDWGNTYTMADTHTFPLSQPAGDGKYDSVATIMNVTHPFDDYQNGIGYLYEAQGPAQENFTPINFANGQPMLVYTDNATSTAYVPYVKYLQFVISAGSYSPDELATLITRKINFMPFQHKTANTSTGYGGGGGNSAPNNNINRNNLLGLVDSFVNDRSKEEGNIPNGANNVGPLYPMLTDISPSYYPLGHTTKNMYLFPATDDEEFIQSATGSNPLNPYPIMYFMRRPNISEEIEPPWNYPHQYDIPQIGATEMALTYNKDNDQKFNWEFLHTPIFINGSPSVVHKRSIAENPFTEITDNISMATLDKMSGVILATLEPRSFWEDILGFNVDSITIPYERLALPPSQRNLTFAEFQAKTTRPYMGSSQTYTSASVLDPNGLKLQMIVNDSTYFNNNQAFQLDDIPFEATDNIVLKAINQPQNPKDSGHILIELDGYDNLYQDDNERYNIKGVVSNYYLTEGQFITSAIIDSFSYVHVGDPIILSEIKCRIINPTDMKPYLPIGQNNTIYLQITKQINQDNIEQTDI